MSRPARCMVCSRNSTRRNRAYCKQCYDLLFHEIQRFRRRPEEGSRYALSGDQADDTRVFEEFVKSAGRCASQGDPWTCGPERLRFDADEATKCVRCRLLCCVRTFPELLHRNILNDSPSNSENHPSLLLHAQRPRHQQFRSLASSSLRSSPVHDGTGTHHHRKSPEHDVVVVVGAASADDAQQSAAAAAQARHRLSPEALAAIAAVQKHQQRLQQQEQFPHHQSQHQGRQQQPPQRQSLDETTLRMQQVIQQQTQLMQQQQQQLLLQAAPATPAPPTTTAAAAADPVASAAALLTQMWLANPASLTPQQQLFLWQYQQQQHEREQQQQYQRQQQQQQQQQQLLMALAGSVSSPGAVFSAAPAQTQAQIQTPIHSAPGPNASTAAMAATPAHPTVPASTNSFTNNCDSSVLQSRGSSDSSSVASPFAALVHHAGYGSNPFSSADVSPTALSPAWSTASSSSTDAASLHGWVPWMPPATSRPVSPLHDTTNTLLQHLKLQQATQNPSTSKPHLAHTQHQHPHHQHLAAVPAPMSVEEHLALLNRYLVASDLQRKLLAPQPLVSPPLWSNLERLAD